MALTCGFFNSINKDRLYDAIQFGQIFDGIIADGVYATYLKGMVVIASDNPNEVIIQPGRAWFNHTWSYNDANLPFEAPEPEVLLDRIDTLVLDVNLEQAERDNTYIWVQGTPSSQNPQPPALIRSVTHNQYPLCDVYRKAGTTMIYTKDITNRIGTSDTPFATGVLEGIDLDMWINQWDDEFHTWEIDTKAEFDAWELNSKNSFEVWMLSQQQVYTAWFNSIKDQMSDDLAEFEAWFETIKDIIDESAALHLQAEIDEINKKLPSGSHITITTENTELFGRNVTVTDGTHPTIVKFDNSGVAEVETYPYVGNITITSTDGIRTATITTHIPYFGRYSYGISFWAAVVNIIGDEEFATYPVTVKNSNGDILTTIVLNSSAQGTWTAIEPDTYTFSVTYGGETMEVSLNVTQETTYTVEIHAQPAGFDFEEWLTAGDVSGTYADLDAVLADEVAIRKLMTKHASVDYLASFTDEDESVITILNNDLCAKWISLRDYAMDVLEAVYGTLMASIGDTVLVGQVPVMTSNTTPSGEAGASAYYHSDSLYAPWRAFNGTNASTGWLENAWGDYVYYRFTSPKTVKQISAYYYDQQSRAIRNTIQVIASNDGSTWINLGSEYTMSGTNVTDFVSFDNNTAYEYYGVKATGSASGHNVENGNGWKFQFYAEEIQNKKYGYGEWALLPQVPTMTSNTAPSGECLYSDQYYTRYAYYAFDNNWDKTVNTAAAITSFNGWASGSDRNVYLGYDFGQAVRISQVAFRSGGYASGPYLIDTYKIQYSDDNSIWTDATNELTAAKTYDKQVVTLPSASSHRYWRLFIVFNGLATYATLVSNLQFYAWQPKGNVPIMTSNTAPYGEASSGKANTDAYKMFDGNDTTYWTNRNASTTSTSDYVQYKFATPVCIKRIHLFGDNSSSTVLTTTTVLTVKGSNDGTNFTDIGDVNFETVGSVSTDNVMEVNNDDYYLYYRLAVKTTVSNIYMYIRSLQFYGRELKVSVPTMTGNTSPYGEAFLGGPLNANYPAFQVFDGNDSTVVAGDGTGGRAYVGYDFGAPCKIQKASILLGNYYGRYTDFMIQGSNDKFVSDIHDLSSEHTITQSTLYTFDLDSTGLYRYYRVIGNGGGACIIQTLQFYGIDYSEREWDTEHPRHYIYDHGLELETLTVDGYTISGSGVSAPNKEPSQLYFPATNNSSAWKVIGLSSALDTSPYTTERICIGDKATEASNKFGDIAVSSVKANYANSVVATTALTYSLQYPYQIGLDVSSINQSAFHIISSGYYTRSLTITEWWLE